MGKTPFASQYQQAASESDDERVALFKAAQATIKEDATDETALVVYSCVAPRDATWQQVASKLLTTHPKHAVARGWAQYSAFFANPAADSVMQDALRRLLTYGTDDYTYTSDPARLITHDLVSGTPTQSMFQWAALADAARLQLGATNPHVNTLDALVRDNLLREAKRHADGLDIEDDDTDAPEPSSAEGGKRLFEMLWDCRFCGTSKLLGKSQRFCPVCGAAQDPSWRYFPSDEEKIYLDDHPFTGKDAVCESCGHLNSGDAAHCVRCGAPMEGAEGVRTIEERSRAQAAHFETQDLYARLDREAEQYARGIEPGTATTPAQKTSGGVKRWQIGVGVSVIVAIVGLIFAAIFWTSTEDVSVTGHRWERSIEIESVQAIEERREGTCRSVAPADAYREREREEQVDTERVQVDEVCRVIQRDRGDGVGEEVTECDPVYENRAVMGPVCYFTVDRWTYDRSVSAEGGLNDPVEWPIVDLRRSNCNSLGCERQGDRDEDYILLFVRNDENFSCEVDETEWRGASRGDQYTVEVGRIGGGERCNTLERAQ